MSTDNNTSSSIALLKTDLPLPAPLDRLSPEDTAQFLVGYRPRLSPVERAKFVTSQLEKHWEFIENEMSDYDHEDTGQGDTGRVIPDSVREYTAEFMARLTLLVSHL